MLGNISTEDIELVATLTWDTSFPITLETIAEPKSPSVLELSNTTLSPTRYWVPVVWIPIFLISQGVTALISIVCIKLFGMNVY